MPKKGATHGVYVGAIQLMTLIPQDMGNTDAMVYTLPIPAGMRYKILSITSKAAAVGGAPSVTFIANTASVATILTAVEQSWDISGNFTEVQRVLEADDTALLNFTTDGAASFSDLMILFEVLIMQPSDEATDLLGIVTVQEPSA